MAFHQFTTTHTAVNPPNAASGRILFICTGNICRSAFGQHYLARTLNHQVPGAYVVQGAGTQINPRLRVPDQVLGLEGAAGLATLTGHEPQRLAPTMARDADLVLAATQDHVGHVLRDTPAALKRTFTILEFAALAELILQDGDVEDSAGVPAANGGPARGGPAGTDLRALAREAARRRSQVRSQTDDGLDLPDPYGGPDEGYHTMGEQMAPALDRIAELLVSHARARGLSESQSGQSNQSR